MSSLFLSSVLQNSKTHIKVIAVGARDWSTRGLFHVFKIYADQRFKLGINGPLWFSLWSSESGKNLVELAVQFQAGGWNALHSHQAYSILSDLAFNVSFAFGAATSWWKAGKGIEFSDLNPNSPHRKVLHAIQFNDLETLKVFDGKEIKNWNWKSFLAPHYDDNKGKIFLHSDLKSPLEVAMDNEHWEIVNWLLEKEALLSLKVPPREFYTELADLRASDFDGDEEDDKEEAIDELIEPYESFFEFTHVPGTKSLEIFLRQMNKDLNFSVLGALDFLYERISDAPEMVQSTIDAFNNCLELFPVDKLKEDFKILKKYDKEVGILKGVEAKALSRVIKSYIEKDDLQYHLPQASSALPQRTQRL